MIKKWKVLKSEDVSPSKWFPLEKHTVQTGNNLIIDDFYISKLGDVAMVIPIMDNGRILCVRQYKHGFGDVIIEFPAGRIEHGLSPIQAAELELKEETGYVAGEIHLLGFNSTMPSKDTSKIYGFIAHQLNNTGQTAFDVTEEIELVDYSPSELDDLIIKNKFVGSDSIAFYHIAKLKFPRYFNPL